MAVFERGKGIDRVILKFEKSRVYCTLIFYFPSPFARPLSPPGLSPKYLNSIQVVGLGRGGILTEAWVGWCR